MFKVLIFSLALAAGPAAGMAAAESVTARMAMATPTGLGVAVGSVTVSDGPKGVRLRTDLRGLPPGTHGFHVHEKGSCEPGPDKTGKVGPAGAAGGHLDPSGAGAHLGPMGEGHLGDLPRLLADKRGRSKQTLRAPRIADVSALRGRALMIHAGADNSRDQPAPLGGGGGRIACGVIE